MELTVELFAQSLGPVASQDQALASRPCRHLSQKSPAVPPLLTYCYIKAQQLPFASRVLVLQYLHGPNRLMTARKESIGRSMADATGDLGGLDGHKHA